MNNKNKNKLNANNNSTTKLRLGILAISVIAVLMISPSSVIQYVYATDAPTITSLAVNDPDDLDDVFSNGDTITITFDSDTNTPGGTGMQTKTAVDNLFTFTEPISRAYNGQWTAPDTFTITIRNAINAGPLVIGSTTVTPAGTTSILSSDETSDASSVTSLTLSGDFGEIFRPWMDGDNGVIHYTGGNVGIGTTLPSHLLSVDGVIESTLGGFKFPDGTIQVTSSTGTYQASTHSNWNSPMNNFDEVVSFTCPAGKAITAVYSVHDNDREDRQFRYTCSSIQMVIQ